MIVLYILIAILMFGSLIFIHELGHFLTARLFGVKIYEFAIGMGPKIFSRRSPKNETVYSLRALPIGGYVSMAGEDDACEDEDSFRKKKVWQRIIITSAGSLFNLLLGFLVMLIIVMSVKVGTTTVGSFAPEAKSAESGLMAEDQILEIDGRKVHVFYDLNYKISRYGTAPIDVLVLREGEELLLEDVVFPTTISQGIVFGTRDFYVYEADKNVGTVLKNAFYQSVVMDRMVYDSLYDLITGKYGVEQMSGPVGITGVITDAAQEAVQTKDGSYLWTLFVVLAMNLGCMNLLPFPALDGGRIVFLAYEGIFRHPISPKVEGYIHAGGMILLLLLMLLITFKDVFTLIIK